MMPKYKQPDYKEKLADALRRYGRADGSRYGICESDIPIPIEQGIEILESFDFVRGGHKDPNDIHLPIWWCRKREDGELTENEKNERSCGRCDFALRGSVEPKCPDCFFKLRPLEPLREAESSAPLIQGDTPLSLCL